MPQQMSFVRELFRYASEPKLANKDFTSMVNKEQNMGTEQPKPGAPGTTDDRPRWEGPPETKPRGYLPAKDEPETDRDASGENLNDPDRKTLSDAGKQKGE